MPVLAERGITTTMTGQLDSTTQHDAAFDNRAGQVSEELGLITLVMGSDSSESVSSVALQTKGKSGWTSGSSYQVEIHAYKFKCLKVDKNGKISCSDL